jgi:hypothetical protein
MNAKLNTLGSFMLSVRNIRMDFPHMSKWWPAWAAVAIAFFLFMIGVRLVGPIGIKDFSVNLIVEMIGFLLALFLAWILIERKAISQAAEAKGLAEETQKLADAVRLGVHERLIYVRNTACWPITDFIYRISEKFITHDSTRLGPYYLRNNYDTVKTMLETQDIQNPELLKARYPWFAEPYSTPSGIWRPVFEGYVELARTCETTIRLFGPGLAEYPQVLNSLERLRSSVEFEQRPWETFNDPDNQVPVYALVNLGALSKIAFSLIASITTVLQDWETPFSEQDMDLRQTFHHDRELWHR